MTGEELRLLSPTATRVMERIRQIVEDEYVRREGSPVEVLFGQCMALAGMFLYLDGAPETKQQPALYETLRAAVDAFTIEGIAALKELKDEKARQN